MLKVQRHIASEIALAQLATQLAAGCQNGGTLYLYGSLGAGKTTFSRYLLRGLGHTGNVKSPTYTLVESYDLAALTVFHFDLYRVRDPEELEFMGIRDYFGQGQLCLIEWPERGAPLLPEADLAIELTIIDEHQRTISLTAGTAQGAKMLAGI